MYVNSPTAAPLADCRSPGIRQAKVMIMDVIWPTVPHRNSFLRPTRSMMNHETVAKML